MDRAYRSSDWRRERSRWILATWPSSDARVLNSTVRCCSSSLATAAARAHAFIRCRGYVTPEDVKSVGPDVLRHRVILSYEAEAENVKPEEILRRIFDTVEVP